jgi:hypothetical protein
MRPALLACVILVGACGGSDESLPPVSDASTIDGAGDDVDGATGDLCGGIGGVPCDTGEWCDYPDDSCGIDDGSGTCTSVPTVCKPLEEPVCGCDGTVYVTDCAAAMAGFDVSAAGSCPPPAGDFACGHIFCDAATEYCRRSVSDVVGVPDDWTCVALPNGCNPTADCDCLSGEVCGDMCSVTGDGLRLTCPGG